MWCSLNGRLPYFEYIRTNIRCFENTNQLSLSSYKPGYKNTNRKPNSRKLGHAGVFDFFYTLGNLITGLYYHLLNTLKLIYDVSKI